MSWKSESIADFDKINHPSEQFNPSAPPGEALLLSASSVPNSDHLKEPFLSSNSSSSPAHSNTIGSSSRSVSAPSRSHTVILEPGEDDFDSSSDGAYSSVRDCKCNFGTFVCNAIAIVTFGWAWKCTEILSSDILGYNGQLCSSLGATMAYISALLFVCGYWYHALHNSTYRALGSFQEIASFAPYSRLFVFDFFIIKVQLLQPAITLSSMSLHHAFFSSVC
jgi:hypothetical protein